MDVGTAMSVAQTLYAALQCSDLKEICSIAGCKSKLDELRGTVSRIKAVLKDAEAKQELSEQEQLFVEELKDAVYEADDLFDEFVTLAERKKLNRGIKVRVLSLFSKFGMAYNMTQGVKKIKKKLDAIAFDSRFNLNIDHKPIRNRRLETCSYVYEADIIGRELDLEKIVGVLLDSTAEQYVSFLPIVGIGGLGKTALSQLVYNDARVTTAFPLRLWTCVADENQELLDVKGVICKILASASGQNEYESCTLDGLQSQLRELLEEKKFLLVLDDVWTEIYEQWHTLTQFLMGGQRGSWIVVTTRSWETARIIGNGPMHELQGLSKEDSWCLFKRVAFRLHHSNPPEDLVKIGQDIVEKCANVPLAIKVVGSLLYDQDKQKWLSIQKLGLAQVQRSKNSIMPILKLSYYQLESPLKSCFAYCAIFPKDFVMKKKTLISLWMAQGYIPLDDPQTAEDVAEEYFSILLRRCFFQDVQKDDDDDGDIESCKIHDLMHDVAQEVVGKEISTGNTITGDVDKKVRHLSFTKSQYPYFSSSNTRLRSYLHVRDFYQGHKMDQLCVDALLGNWKYLRALNLSWLHIKILPNSIGELLHLRYLDLSYNGSLEVLPRPITKLYNLQTLNLVCCGGLRELPKDLSKLVKLRVLDLKGCDQLRCMPRCMGKLTCLNTLTLFVVGGTSSSRKELFDWREDLKALRNLKGYLKIKIPLLKTGANAGKKNGGREGGCLENKENLKEVEFLFCGEGGEVREEYNEAVMEELQPHSNLERLTIFGYHGVRMRRWPMVDNLATFLPNLIEMKFINCPKLQYLGQLRLPQLKRLEVSSCPNLIAILQCPSLEDLTLYDFNKRLEVIGMRRIKSKELGDEKEILLGEVKLRDVKIDNVAWLNSLPMDPFQGGAKLLIWGDMKTESLGEAREVFRSCSSSLKSLIIMESNLKSILSGGLEHLTALEELEISNCPNLSLSEAVEREYGIGMPWQPCHHSLRSLKLMSLCKLVDLPSWIKYLTSFETLLNWNCKGVESLPNWMSKLTSLKELRLWNCSERLMERCQQYTGEDWPHIQHIPSVVIY